MKKKILMLLLVCVLALTLTAGLLACKKNNNNDNGGGGGNPVVDPTPTPEVETPEASAIVKTVMTDVSDIVDTIKNVDGKLYVDATIFVKVNDIGGELRIAASLDEVTAANNKALLSFALGDTTYATIYFQDNTIYVGEALFQDEFQWVKFNQAYDSKILTTYIQKLPNLISGGLSGVEDGMIGNLAGTISLFGATLFTMDEFPATYKAEDATLADGTYTLGISVNEISSLVEMLGQGDNGIDIEGMINGLVADNAMLGTIINKGIEIIFGGTLKEVLDGEVKNAPAIALSADYKGGDFTGLTISYEKAATTDSNAIAVSFGLKNVVVNDDTSSTAMKPDVTLNKVKDAALNLNVDLSVPGKDIDATASFYLAPAINIAADGDNVTRIDVTGASVYGYMTLKGEVIPVSANYDLDAGKIVIDLSGLFTKLNVTGYEGYEVLYYDFDLQTILDDLLGYEEAPAPLSAEGDGAEVNAIDYIVEYVMGIFDGKGFDFADVSGILEKVVAIANDIKAAEIFTVDGDNAKISISIEKLLAYVSDEDGIIANSEYAGIAAGMANVESLIEMLAGAFDMEVADLEEKIGYCFGYDGDDIEAYLGTSTLVLSGIRSADDGIGASIALYNGTTEIGTVAIRADLVGVDFNSLPGYADASFNDVDFLATGDLSVEANRDAWWQAMLALREAYFAYPVAVK